MPSNGRKRKKPRLKKRLAIQQLADDDFSRSPISKLPEDCLIFIFELLSIVDRVRIQSVCKLWRRVSLMSWQPCKTLTFNDHDWGYYRCSTGISQMTLRKVLKLCGAYITRIDFTNYWRRGGHDYNRFKASKNLFIPITKLCPNLTAIDMGILLTTRQCIEYLGERRSNLTELKIRCCRDLERPLAILFRNNRNLRRLIVGTQLSGYCLSNLNPLAIEEIDFFVDAFEISGFLNVLKSFINLRKLKINWNFINTYINEQWEAITPHIQQLKVSFYPLFDTKLHFKNFERFPNLQKFALDGKRVTPSNDFFEAIARHCTQLTHLKLKNISVTDDQIENVMELPKLQDLHLSKLEGITDAIFTNVCMPLLENLKCKKCPGLQYFGLSEWLRESAESLQNLKIEICRNVDLKNLIEDAKEAADSRVNGPLLKMYVDKGSCARDDGSAEVTMSSKYFELTEFLA